MSFLLKVRNIITACKCQRNLIVRVRINRENIHLQSVCFSRRLSHFASRENYIPFEALMQSRRSEARRSVIVQVSSPSSFRELYKYCSEFGTIKGVHHYSLCAGKNNYMLVEFIDESSVNHLLAKGASFSDDVDVIRASSPFLWFRAQSTKPGQKNPLKGTRNVSTDGEKLSTIEGCDTKPDQLIMGNMKKCSSISEQIEMLYKATCLNDLETRLRFIVARQVEVAMSGLHVDARVWPFGSSVNGFGRMNSDLDLLYRMDDDTKEINAENRLVFHTKKSLLSSRMLQQKYIEVLADVLQLYLPGCNYIRRILHARIPIIKFDHDHTGLECDLSMSNMTGVYMSELLYLYGCFDDRVRPLFFMIRKWAESIGLTNPSPGKWITNFPLTLLVLFFLQQKTKDGVILPSLKRLIAAARKEDIRITEDSINCTFLRDIRCFRDEYNNENDLGTLLLQLFEFYATFDFELRAISIIEGESFNKPDHSALYIVNPLEMSLNVSKNVSYEECDRIKAEFRNAAWILDGELHKPKINNSDTWGILSLFNSISGKSVTNLVKLGNAQRLVKVTDLFERDAIIEDSDVKFDGEKQTMVMKRTKDTIIVNDARNLLNVDKLNTVAAQSTGVRKVQQWHDKTGHSENDQVIASEELVYQKLREKGNVMRKDRKNSNGMKIWHVNKSLRKR